jgi:prevent-host-death family protein
VIVNVHAAKTNLSRLIEQACAGEEVIIARNSEPVVKLVPVGLCRPRRVFGSMRGEFTVPPEFFEPLPDDELEAWGQ